MSRGVLPPPTTKITPSTSVANIRLSERLSSGGESNTTNLYSRDASRSSARMYSEESKSAGLGGTGPQKRTETPAACAFQTCVPQSQPPVRLLTKPADCDP